MRRDTKPLSGVRVLVGRAKHQAGALSAELRELGAQVTEIPFIEIRPPRSFRPLDRALRHLGSYDWLILTSVNGVEAMWKRMKQLRIRGLPTDGGEILRPRRLRAVHNREGHDFSRATTNVKPHAALAAEGAHRRQLHVAAIGPATKKALEERGVEVDIVPPEYVAESVVSRLCEHVKGKRVLVVRAKVARDVIPRELRRAGAHVDVVEAYETVVPKSSRARLRVVLQDARRRPEVITFTSSSTVRNFVTLLGGAPQPEQSRRRSRGLVARRSPADVNRAHSLDGIRLASIGPVTSSTLRELGLPVDIEAREYTIPGLVAATVEAKTGR